MVEREVVRRFRSEAGFRASLAETKENVPNLLFIAKVNLLEEKIRGKLNARIGALTHAELAQYYAEHRAQYYVREQRDMGLVRTKRSAAVAGRMKRELASGVSYAALAKRFAAEQPPYTKDGLLLGLEPHAFKEQSINDAIFSAKQGVLSGPVFLNVGPHFDHRSEQDIQNIRGYYLFTVDKIVPGHETPLSQVEPALKPILPILLEKREVAALVRRVRPKWRAMTDCSPGYVVLKCRQYRPSAAEPDNEDPYTLN